MCFRGRMGAVVGWSYGGWEGERIRAESINKYKESINKS